MVWQPVAMTNVLHKITYKPVVICLSRSHVAIARLQIVPLQLILNILYMCIKTFLKIVFLALSYLRGTKSICHRWVSQIFHIWRIEFNPFYTAAFKMRIRNGTTSELVHGLILRFSTELVVSANFEFFILYRSRCTHKTSWILTLNLKLGL